MWISDTAASAALVLGSILLASGCTSVEPPAPTGLACSIGVDVPYMGSAVLPDCSGEPLLAVHGWTLKWVNQTNDTLRDPIPPENNGQFLIEAPEGSQVGDVFKFEISLYRIQESDVAGEPAETFFLQYYEVVVTVVGEPTPASLKAPPIASVGVPFQATLEGEFPENATFSWYVDDETGSPISDVTFDPGNTLTTMISIPIEGTFTVRAEAAVGGTLVGSATSSMVVTQPLDPPVLRQQPAFGIPLYEHTPMDFYTQSYTNMNPPAGFLWAIEPCPFANPDQCTYDAESFSSKFPAGTYTVSLVVTIGQRVSIPGTLTFTVTKFVGAPVANLTGSVSDGTATLDASTSENASEYEFTISAQNGATFMFLETSGQISSPTWQSTVALPTETRIVAQVRVWNEGGEDVYSQLLKIQ